MTKLELMIDKQHKLMSSKDITVAKKKCMVLFTLCLKIFKMHAQEIFPWRLADQLLKKRLGLLGQSNVLTGIQEVAGLILGSDTIFHRDLVMKKILRPFSPYRWFK